MFRNICGRSTGSQWTVSNGTLVSGLTGKSYRFSGTGYIGLDKSVIAGYPFTVIAFFSTTNMSASARCIFSSSNSGSTTPKLGLRLNSSHFPQAFVGTNVVTGTTAANDGALHSIAMSANAAGTVSLYYDGGLVGTVAGGTFPALNRTTLGAIRSATTTESWTGDIAFPLLVYSRQLDPIEIQRRILNPFEWARGPSANMLHVPEAPVVTVFQNPIQPGGATGNRVNLLHPQTRGIQAWFPLNHVEDKTAPRSLVGRVRGTSTNVAWNPTGPLGGRLTFNDTTSLIEYPGGEPQFEFNTGDKITVFVRIRPTGTLDDVHYIVGKEDGFIQFNWLLGIRNPGLVEFHFRSSGVSHHYVSDDSVVTSDKDQAIAFTMIYGKADSPRCFYVDEHGRARQLTGYWLFPETGTPGVGDPIIGTGPIRIGCRTSTTNHFSGSISDIRVMRTYADVALIQSIARRPWDSIMRPGLLSLVSHKSVAIGQPSTIATALAASPIRTYLTGLPSESDSSFAVTSRKTFNVGAAPDEIDTAFALNMAKVTAVGQSLETNSPLAASATRTYSTGLPSESGSSLALTRSKSIAVGIPSETDTSQPLVHSRFIDIGQPSESDSAFDVPATRIYIAGQPSDAETAFTFTKSKELAIGLSLETDEALAAIKDKVLAIGQSSDTETAFDTILRRSFLIAQVAESDSAFSFAQMFGTLLGLAQEQDEALMPIISHYLPVEMASEFDTAEDFTFERTYLVGQAQTDDSALDLMRLKTVVFSFATETDSVFEIFPTGVFLIGVDFSAIGIHMDMRATDLHMDLSSATWEM